MKDNYKVWKKEGKCDLLINSEYSRKGKEAAILRRKQLKRIVNKLEN